MFLSKSVPQRLLKSRFSTEPQGAQSLKETDTNINNNEVKHENIYNILHFTI